MDDEREFDPSERAELRRVIDIVTGTGKEPGLGERMRRIELLAWAIITAITFIAGLLVTGWITSQMQRMERPINTNTNRINMLPQDAAESGEVRQAAALRGGYTTGEYAELTGMSVREVQQRCKDGEIKSHLSGNGHYLIAIDQQ